MERSRSPMCAVSDYIASKDGYTPVAGVLWRAQLALFKASNAASDRQ
ncbi:hypothetical protein QUB63_18340 [Microcoleus sp. ARI1-B5]